MLENNKFGTVIENLYNRNINNLRLPAFEGLGDHVDFKMFFDAVDTYAKAFLELGVKDGDIVTLCLAGTLDTIINFYALNTIGAVANIVNPNYFKVNSKKYINDTNSKLLIVMDRFYPLLKESIEQTNVEKIVLSSITEYSSILYKILLRRKNIKKSDYIAGVDYFTLPEFIKFGEQSKLAIPKKQYVKDKEAAITYTSGSTGNPKGVVLTNDSFNNMIAIYDIKDGFGSKVGDRNMLLIPPMYGTSLCHSINTPLAFGCTTILQPMYNPNNFAKDLKKYEPNIVVASKAHYINLLNYTLQKDSMKFVKMAFCGGEPITKSLANDINDKLNYLGVPNLIIGYGMSEFGTMTMFNMDIKDRVNQSGYLLPEIRAKIINPVTGEKAKINEKGDLLISTPAKMKGYYKDPEATNNFFVIDEEGVEWGKTGDIATVDENGVYNVLGRKKDSFTNEDGKIVYLFEIENLVESIDYIRECEVISLTIDGKIYPIVHIILKDEYKNNRADIIKVIDQVCKQNLKNYEIPYAYKIRDSFQTSPISGKRDYESLKYETDNYLKIVDNKIEILEIISEESKVSNELEEVKKLHLKI